MAEQPKLRRGGTWIQRWRVPMGFICAAFFIVLARPRPATLIAGAVVSLFGLILRAWSAGHIRKNDALATSGPYAYTRNPLYLGSFILGLGFTIASGRWELSPYLIQTVILAVLFVSLFLGIYLPVMRVESATLTQLFSQSYQRYALEVPLFLPRLIPYRDKNGGGGRFDVSLYLRYREYRAALGLLIAWGVLVLKSYFLNYLR